MSENPESQANTQVEEAFANAQADAPKPEPESQTITPPRMKKQESGGLAVEESGTMNMIMGVNLQVTVELGRTELTVKEVLDLQKGSVVELARVAGEAVDIYINNSLIARGDVVVVDDKYGVRITELVPIEARV